ncbi:MAG: glycosyltransferase [Actinomycetaceae bacterium]|nr:glycosyltransferase [Actinomycetaceae bacterium]
MIGFRTRGPLVSELSRGRVRVERGRRQDLVTRERVAIVAQFSIGPVQSRSLSTYLMALDAAGYATIVVSTCESEDPLAFPFGIPETTVVMRRPNVGYDFGSWATALGCVPEIRDVPVVLLTNDSLLGPFAPINHLLEWAAKPGPDIRGLTASHQFARHTQSFFLAFRSGSIAEKPWVDFFNNIREEPDKDNVVLHYELGASRLCFSEAYSSDEWVTGPDLGVPYGNPTVDGWKKLIESGVPFLKRTIMTHPTTLAECVEAKTYIERTFNVDVTDW